MRLHFFNSAVIENSKLDYCMMYADESQVYITANPEDGQTTITNLEQYLRDVQAFFADNILAAVLRKLK